MLERRKDMLKEILDGKFFRYLIFYAISAIAIYVILLVPGIGEGVRLPLIYYVALAQFIISISGLIGLRKKKKQEEKEVGTEK
jgi:hypothetical protein